MADLQVFTPSVFNNIYGMKRLSLLVVLLAGTIPTVAAQPYEVANPDARTLGFGGIETVTTADAYSVFNNPSAMLFGRQKAQAATSFFTLNDKTSYSVAGYYKFNQQHALAAGWATYDFDPARKNKAVSLAYSYRLNERAALGLTADYARFVRLQTGNALSATVSAQAVVPFDGQTDYSALRLGAKLSGIGGFLDGPAGMKLPVAFAVGAAYERFFSDAHALTVAGECRYAFSPNTARGVEGGIALEYSLMQLLQFRMGYHGGGERLYFPNYFAMGIGVRFMHLCFDAGYAIAEKGSPMRNACSLTVGLDF